MYASALQLLDTFGDNEVALLSSEEAAVDGVLLRLTVEAGDRSAYTAGDIAFADQALIKINAALDSATRLINSYISPRYTLPLVQVLIDSSSLADVCADITRHRLSDDRVTEEVENRFKQARSWLRDISMNKASLGEEDTGTATPTGRIKTGQGNSGTNWSSY